MDAIETDIILLRKLVYGEHALIVNGISAEYGRLDFIVRGGSGGMSRACPEVEVFREIRAKLVRGKGDLFQLQEVVSVVDDFSCVSRNYSVFQAANWIASFSLKNVMPMLAHPLYFNAVDVALHRLLKDDVLPVAVLTGVSIAFVFEEGWLAPSELDEKSAAQCKTLLEMAAGLEPPKLSESSWNEQFQWVQQLLEYRKN